MSFLNSIEQQDHETFDKDWERLTVHKEEIHSELRLVKPWIRQERHEAVRDTTWILFLALPQLDADGNLIKVFGCTTVGSQSPINWLFEAGTYAGLRD